MAITKDKLVEILTIMLRIRTFEESVQKEFAAGTIPGIVHLYLGEEAIAAGACANLTKDDFIVSTHRGHGHLIAKGGKTDLMMAEVLGRKTGYCHGKGGSMHVADPDIGMLGANGIVGAGLPIATGAAASAQIRGTDQVAICFFGEGASNTSRFHESINMAAAWKLPVIYLIENNLWAVSTRSADVMGESQLSKRAIGYGIPGVDVDGNDAVAMYEAVAEAVARARKGDGPTLMVCTTYRWRGHMEGDPQFYKPKEEAEEWLKQDPLPRFRKYLTDTGTMTAEEIDAIQQGMVEEMEKALKFAKDSPFPSPEETLEDIFA
ncbi:MAG: thiamine pyrophosphate-dependent dehydrogenase E1 component subunit alpha [Dehalococcoidales bacterium]